jgi:hypothetical protein
MVTAAVPLDVSVRGCAVAVFTITLPNPIVVAFTVNLALAAVGERLIVNVLVTPPA